MALLHIFLISVTLSESMAARAAYYTKHTPAVTGPVTAGVSLLKTVECGVKYLDEQFGVFKIRDDGTECNTMPWAWFDTQNTETGYTYYRKDRMKLTFEPPLYLYSDEWMSKTEYVALFPSPMYTDSKVEVYFTPKIPISSLAIELLGAITTDQICRFKAISNRINEYLIMVSRINGIWTPGGKRLYGDIPFNTETTYKVTFKATQTDPDDD